ncbi:MAG TPA: glycosyltransferase family 4 protein, partial [Dokdonella sp.]
HVTLSFSHGGRREAIAELCRGLTAHGVVNRLCCVDEIEVEQANLAPLFEESIELKRRSLFDASALSTLRRFCFERAIDIVHTHDAASQAVSVLALPFGGPKMLMTFHRTRNFESARVRDRLRNALAGLRGGAIVTASEERRRHYIESNHVRTSKVRCIPLGIDLDRFRPDPARRALVRESLGLAPTQTVVGAVGHFGPEKGIDIAIEAFQHYVRAHPATDAHLVVLGAGSDAQERFVRSRIAADVADRIDFVGFQAHPEDWFPAFDLLLHGARSEAFGLVLVEAMACGVPVVAARVGGIPEIIEEGRSGRLAASAEPAPLAEAVAGVLADPDRLAQYSLAARERARSAFGSARYARQYFELYCSLLHLDARTTQAPQ